MIYGNRFFEKTLTLKAKNLQKVRKFRIVNKAFQWKYTLFLLSAFFGSSVLFLGPVWYFLNQNYEFFYKIAYDTHPEILSHLDREIVWLGFYIGVTCFCTLVFTGWISIRMTEQIIGPLISMERHLRKATLGDWSSPDFRIRSTDDFRNLADAYSYFYRSLKANTENEIKVLEKLQIDPQNREAYAAWEYLVNSKKAQLGLPTNSSPIVGTVAKISSSPDSRRVS